MPNLKKIQEIIGGLIIRDSWKKMTNCDVLLVRHDNDCAYTYDGKAYSHLLDSIGERCTVKKLSVKAVATPFSKRTLKNAHNAPVSLNQAIIFAFLISKILIIIRGENYAKNWKKSYIINVWCSILDKANPKIVIGIQPDEYLCESGKLKEIPIYDFQHGIISDNHLWYGEKYCIRKPNETIPDGFLCWDEQSAETILKWANDKGITVLNVGNPWFLRFLNPHLSDQLVLSAVEDMNQLFDDRPCILVSLQWGMTETYNDNDIDVLMVSALQEVIKDSMDIYNWILRLHPVQMRGIERTEALNHLIKNFGTINLQRWLVASEIPLPLLLKKVDLHITYDSTVVIEASWMGIRSGLLGNEFYPGGVQESSFIPERRIGMAEILPHDSEIIKNWIVNTLAKGRNESTIKQSSQSLDEFIDEINPHNR